MKSRLLAIVLVGAVGLSACSEPAVTAPGVVDLAGVEQLADDFNEAADSPRLILLLSPT